MGDSSLSQRFKGVTGASFTARIGRAQFYRARYARCATRRIMSVTFAHVGKSVNRQCLQETTQVASFSFLTVRVRDANKNQHHICVR